MDRMNQRSAMAYWKLSTIVVVFVGVTSYLSVRAHESSKLPREHILKYSELLREAARASIQSTQDQHPVQSFIDSSKAMCAVNIVSEFLTPHQVKHIMNVDIGEMKEFISKQHDDATSALVQARA
ncbi:unnamed protein product [Ectocarpus sp. 4 AP-2014]|uniref:EsV-1-67 n=1 Tax=Ectocarpus siliculosus virus 1 (isolate New Zealand/Kaikoura/1988) TaxID=654926 RepID=Q8QKV6_ESV1K|nr:EsV-1-67 [Ectocarpus siliculosus virus 1]AAK14490.1 EsV-1-67 [Ectocarpus siliculosus virus 1]